jgi:endonuclease/exonuclease/phosphatase family metal-dependent hydrolase
MVRIASYNVENLFARPNAFNPLDWSEGRPVLDAYHKVGKLIANNTYNQSDKQEIRDLLVELDIYSLNTHGAARRKRTPNPRWAWLRKNRGAFDRQPVDATREVEITASGRDDWIGWVELATAPTDAVGTRMTARVIQDVDADIIGMVEAEDRPSLVRFNKELLNGLYEHVMLVDGNDERGIDVGVMTKTGFDIKSISSNVDARDGIGIIFSRDCPQYEIETPSGNTIHLLVNHFKSQSGGGGAKRKRQADEVRRIVDRLVAQGKRVIVLGDLNEGPASAGTQAENLAPLFDNNSPLVDCYSLHGFQEGPKPGTFDSCGLRNRFDYILLTQNLIPSFLGGGLFREGLWGTRKTRPTEWATYQEMTRSSEQASDHAVVYIELNI